MKLKRYRARAYIHTGGAAVDMIKDPKGDWIRFKDMVDDAKGLADALIEFGNEMLELIGEEEDDNSQ